MKTIYLNTDFNLSNHWMYGVYNLFCVGNILVKSRFKLEY